MKLKMDLSVLQIADSDYQVEVTAPDNSVDIDVFKRSNAVFGAYVKLRKHLAKYQDVAIHITTNSSPLAREFNETKPNPNARLLKGVKEVISRNNLDITVEYVA